MKIDVKTLEKLVWILYRKRKAKRYPNKNRSVYSNKNGFSL